MIFEWDENKNWSNFKKHGVSFEEAVESFQDINALIEVSYESYEVRLTMIAQFENRILFVVYLKKLNATYRIISARSANKKERMAYENR